MDFTGPAGVPRNHEKHSCVVHMHVYKIECMTTDML